MIMTKNQYSQAFIIYLIQPCSFNVCRASRNVGFEGYYGRRSWGRGEFGMSVKNICIVIQADNKDDAKYIYLFCYIKSSNNKKDMSEMGDSSNQSDFSENLEGQIIDEAYNKVLSDCQSFLEPFKHIVQNQQGLTDIDIEAMYQNPHHKLSWEQSRIEIPSQIQIQFVPHNLGLLQSDYSQKSPLELKEMMKVLIKQNEDFRYNFHVLKQKLQYIVINIHKKLSSLKNFNYFTDYSEQSQILQCVDMTKFIESTINKITETSFQFSTLEQNVLYLKVQNQIISKDIQKLLAYIQVRKNYSQNLKSKITSLKDQLKKQKEKNEGIEIHIESLKAELIQTREKETKSNMILEELNKIEENVDLKFRNRSQLIRMVKSLSVKIIKHQKECPGMGKQICEGQVMHEFLNSIPTKKKVVNPENK